MCWEPSGRVGCWAEVGALRRPAKPCGMGTHSGSLKLFSEHGWSHPLLETDGHLGKCNQLHFWPYEETYAPEVYGLSIFLLLDALKFHSYPWTLWMPQRPFSEFQNFFIPWITAKFPIHVWAVAIDLSIEFKNQNNNKNLYIYAGLKVPGFFVFVFVFEIQYGG